MEKVLQILAVFALLMLFIWRSIRGREDRFRRFSFLGRVRSPLSEGVRQRLVEGVFGTDARREAFGVPEEAEAFLLDEESRMLLVYWRMGSLRSIGGWRGAEPGAAGAVGADGLFRDWLGSGGAEDLSGGGGGFFRIWTGGLNGGDGTSIAFEKGYASANPFPVFIKVHTDHFALA